MANDKNTNQANIDKMLVRMEDVEQQSGSSTMCLAKWLQSTVYLMNGYTHSCHHPSAHKIPLEELEKDPGALHNTEHKKKQRVIMLKNERPKECGYCWNIEDLPGDHISDRTYKSANTQWAYPHLDKVLDSGDGSNIYPSYLEVAFENTCNLKCMYCTPDISSKWMEEINQHGPYQGTTYNVGDVQWLKQIGKMPIPNKDHNPYVDAFWKWWPDLYQHLDTFRITGGEPLLSKNTWRVFEEIKKNPRKDLTLAINTNLQVPDHIIDRFIAEYNVIAPQIKAFEVYTSCEAAGPQAEYIRYGLNYVSFMRNVRKFLESTTVRDRLNFMVTFNMLSLSTFKTFISDILELRKEFNDKDELNRLPMMISYLRWPQFQDVRCAPLDVKERFYGEILEFVSQHLDNESDQRPGRFYLEELDQIQRLGSYMMEPLDDNYQATQRKDFQAFFPEYDRRKGLNFSETFPELVPYLNS